MTETRYHAVQRWFKKHRAALKTMLIANKVLTILVYLSYLVMLGTLVFTRDSRLWRAILVPAAVFLGGTALRAIINAPRPYEVYRTPALVNKDRAGQSFPSRHMFSSAILAMCGLWLCPPLGVALGVVVVLMAPIRVLCGVHFVRDVVAGVAFGVVGGIIGFWVV